MKTKHNTLSVVDGINIAEPVKARRQLSAAWMVLMVALAVIITMGLVAHGHSRAAVLGLVPLACLCYLSIYTDLPMYSFPQNVKDALVGKEGYPLEIVSGTLNVQLNSSGIPIGVMFERLEGSQTVKVHLRGPIRKGIAGGAISAPSYVAFGSTGLTAVTAGSGNKANGIAIFPYTAATGDIVSFIQTDCTA